MRSLLEDGRGCGCAPTAACRELLAVEESLWTFARAEGVAPLFPEPNMPPLAELAASASVSTVASWDDVGRWYWGFLISAVSTIEIAGTFTSQNVAWPLRSRSPAFPRSVLGTVMVSTRRVGS